MRLSPKTAITTGGMSDSTERAEIKELGISIIHAADGVMWLITGKVTPTDGQ